MKITVKGAELPMEEIRCYEKYIREKYPDRKMNRMVIEVDGEYVDITTYYDEPPFERIRRITGYLVGTVDRFNDAKRAEVSDRVKHEFSPTLLE